MSAKPELVPLRGGWILRAGSEYAPRQGVVQGAILLTPAELEDLRSLLLESVTTGPGR